MIPITFLLPVIQGHNHGGIEGLGDHIFLHKPLHQPLVFYLLMGGVLIYNQQFILIGNQPVSLEELTDNLIVLFGFRRKQSVIK